MKKIYILALLAMTAAMFGGAAVQAQTPDGETPAVETVCDVEVGAAFGLCNAYCEAMDCELANDGDPLTEPNAAARACNRVANNFTNITGRAYLPCDPCEFQTDPDLCCIANPDDPYCEPTECDPDVDPDCEEQLCDSSTQTMDDYLACCETYPFDIGCDTN